jgi:hypothetical protein
VACALKAVGLPTYGELRNTKKGDWAEADKYNFLVSHSTTLFLWVYVLFFCLISARRLHWRVSRQWHPRAGRSIGQGRHVHGEAKCQICRCEIRHAFSSFDQLTQNDHFL